MSRDQAAERHAAFLPDPAGVYSILVFLVLFLLAGGKMLNDSDTLWHIRAGTVMLDQGSVLRSDIFSHTAFGKAWTAHE